MPDKARSNDRLLILKAKPGATSSTGLVDPRLFNGENRLHILMDPTNLLWSFKYDAGAVPPVLKNQKFTTFSAAYKVAEEYFSKRNIEITEVID